MQFIIPRQYDHTAELLNLTNPEDIGLDQYVPNYEALGNLACSFGIDPRGGSLTVYVPVIINVDTPYIRNPRNANNQPLAEQNRKYRLGPATPMLNAYGQIYGYSYYTTTGSND